MTLCKGGLEVPERGRCTFCGARRHQPCGKIRKERELQRERDRIKRIADRAEQRTNAVKAQ